MVRTQLEFYISEIKKRLERLHELSEYSLMRSLEAFKDLNQELASEIRKSVDDIEELADKIEENIFETIARRQPVASDLRALASYLHVTHSLYRVGRFAYKIAHIVKLSEDLEHYKELESLPLLADLAKQTLEIAMNALLTGDMSKIDELEKMEAESDKETGEMFEEISEFLRKRTDITTMSMFYVIVGRYLERASDHAFSIAERAIYLHTGERQNLGIAYKTEGPH